MSNTIEIAQNFAYIAHAGQLRKGKDIPFITHLQLVGEIIKRLTDDENLIAAAYLHDVVEDTDITIDQINEKFGQPITRYVELETEDKMRTRAETTTWKSRKDEQLSRLRNLKEDDKDVLFISLSDKLANLTEMYSDYQEVGNKLWERFNNSNLDDQQWYYSEFSKIIATHNLLKDSIELKTLNHLIKEIFG